MWNKGFALKHSYPPSPSRPPSFSSAGISTCCLQSAHIWQPPFLLSNRHLCVSHYHTFPPSGCAAASRQLTCGVTLRRPLVRSRCPPAPSISSRRGRTDIYQQPSVAALSLLLQTPSHTFLWPVSAPPPCADRWNRRRTGHFASPSVVCNKQMDCGFLFFFGIHRSGRAKEKKLPRWSQAVYNPLSSIQVV